MWHPPSTETTGTSTNWNFACKVTMPGPSAAWIKAWIETDSLWKPTVAVGVQASFPHLLIGWTEKTLDCIRALILPLSNPIFRARPRLSFVTLPQNITLPCYTHTSIPYKTIPVKNSYWIYIWKHLYHTWPDFQNINNHTVPWTVRLAFILGEDGTERDVCKIQK